MISTSRLPQGWFREGGNVSFVESPSGRERGVLLNRLRRYAEQENARVWVLPCAFEEGGPWAGIRDFLGDLVERVFDEKQELLRRHDYEIAHVLPEMKRRISVRNPCLTDIAGPDEKVRNYPADRAYRIVHGLIDLLSSLKEAGDTTNWVLLCDNFEAIGHIGHRFFKELMRRRGERLRLTLVLVTEPGRGQRVRESLNSGSTKSHLRVPASVERDNSMTIEDYLQHAVALEEAVRGDKSAQQSRLADLISFWSLAERPDRVFYWKCRGLDIYNTQGFYLDALTYGEGLLGEHLIYDPENTQLRWAILVKLFMSHLGLSRVEEARLILEEVQGKLSDHFQRAQLCYLVSMLHVRFLPEKDLAKGEALLEEGLAELQGATISEENFHFQSVFNRNGLALIRHLQGRSHEAIELCREGYRQLELHLSPDHHRLHRSVLLYNMAQVYSAMGDHDSAISHYSKAMEMDPNYSEYYNERGAVYFRAGRTEEALNDFLSAAELSAPYYEIYVNLGQCWRAMARMSEAEEAYTRALDLEPDHALALLGRAQAREALGELLGALGDYSAALTATPGQWDAYANRAVLYYELGRPEAALADLDLAISLAPEEAALYQNRAVAFEALGRLDEAASDLDTYLRLSPDAAADTSANLAARGC
jgi:tetratricopeptide (TPR) repeat protein